MHSLWRLPLKLGLIQTLSRLCSLRPDFGRNADWLLEQCHKIWLAVGINGSWKPLFFAWLSSRMTSRRRREGSTLLSFLLFYGLMVKNMPWYVPWKFRKFMWLFISSQDLLHLRNYLQIKILSILKVVSFESLSWNDFSERGTQAEAHCQRNLNRQPWSNRRKTSHRCSRNFCRHYYKSWWR